MYTAVRSVGGKFQEFAMSNARILKEMLNCHSIKFFPMQIMKSEVLKSHTNAQDTLSPHPHALHPLKLNLPLLKPSAHPARPSRVPYPVITRPASPIPQHRAPGYRSAVISRRGAARTLPRGLGRIICIIGELMVTFHSPTPVYSVEGLISMIIVQG